MKRLIVVLIILSTSSRISAQELQWEKTFQDGHQHQLIEAYQFGFDNVALREMYQPSANTINVQRSLSVSWNGEVHPFDNFPSEWIAPSPFQITTGYVFSIGSTKTLCGWCATGFYGEWNLLGQNLNNWNSRQNFHHDINLFDEYPDFFAQLDTFNSTNNLPHGFPQAKGIYQPNPSQLIIAGGHVIANVILQQPDQTQNIENYELLYSNRNILGLLKSASNQGLIWTKDSLFSIDSELQVALIQALPFHIDSVREIGIPNQFIGFSGDSIIRFNEQGAVIELLDLTEQIQELRQFEWTLDGYRMLVEMNNQIRLISVSNSIETFNLLIDTAKFDARLFVFQNDESEFMLFGHETAVDNKHLVIRKYDFEPSSFAPDNLNLAIEAIEFMQTSRQACYFNPVLPDRTDHDLVPLKVTIKNTSSLPVNSFFINAKWDSTGSWPSYIYCPPCVDRQVSIRIDSLISPGNSLEIELFLQNPGSITAPFLPICIWTSSPNFNIDVNPLDDKICAEVPMNVAEIMEVTSSVKIFPNPSLSTLNYVWLGKNTTKDIEITIFDASARSVLSQIRSKNDGAIDIQFLSHGFYIIEFKSGAKIERLRLIKQ